MFRSSVCVDNNTLKWKSGEKWGRPGRINRMNDGWWTWGGRRGTVPIGDSTGPESVHCPVDQVWVVHCKFNAGRGRQLQSTVFTLIFGCPPNPLVFTHMMNSARPSTFCFCRSSTCVYYCDCKPNYEKQGRPGNEVLLWVVGSLWRNRPKSGYYNTVMLFYAWKVAQALL